MTEQQIYNAAFNGTLDALNRAMAPDMTQVEAATVLGKTPRTIHRMTKDGRLKLNVKGKLDRSEVFDYLKK